MNEKAFKEIIIKNIAVQIAVNYQDERDDEDFNAQGFAQEMFSEQRVHFHQHPSAHAVRLCENMTYEEKNRLFAELFKAAWEKFVIQNKK